jgi:hypothetical protein
VSDRLLHRTASRLPVNHADMRVEDMDATIAW